MELDIGMLPPEIQAKLAMLANSMSEAEPEGEVSYERLLVLNDEVFDIRKKLLKAQYNGAVTATSTLIDGIENESDNKTKQQTLKMAIVSLESTIDESKKDLMQALLKEKFESRKKSKRGSKDGEDMDMLDVIIAAAEEEANYDPAEIYQKVEKTNNPKRTSDSGFGFSSSNRA